ncbi:hypothetical protein HBI56_131080 [Parastagonospora nodorum]|nr:hypothetical protein HBH52_165920 [Parastagonospora nodorum]KAH4029551.1 hypothetical protein HBI09_134810 [Parastagonospora nodorum]KAH4047554.1 hypothetical protein HBH49_166690 [Parastagonospora nodorum]KAH4164935.1 hypothetical protein HBH43_147410 [Parastagonospora nodorum]KAH4220014.1 hypothetical protein HBI06_179830 [Parastagonospora nodorum]
MASAQRDPRLIALHEKAVRLLVHKLKCIPARVFPSGRKPTIIDIYQNNVAAFHIPNFPPCYQLDFVLGNYHLFVAADFKVRKKEGDMNVSLAIWFWQMDQYHSFSRRHLQVRLNILMACIIGLSTEPHRYVTEDALEFSTALLDAWLWTVTRQDDYEKQEIFLTQWVNGPYDLMRFGKKARLEMCRAVKNLEKYVPDPQYAPPDNVPIWEGVKYVSPKFVKTFGPAWAIQHIVAVEKSGKKIDELGKTGEVEDALATGSFFAGFGSMGLGPEPSGLSLEVFGRPLVQALLHEEEDLDMAVPAEGGLGEAWMNPADAIEMVEGTSARYEGMKDLFSKVKWGEMTDNAA